MVSARFGIANLKVPADREIIMEGSEQRLSFNVMPNKDVTETLFVHHYEVSPNFIRSVFDRSYSSEMRDSPDHYTFLSALTQNQKMGYVYLCWRFGLPYDPHAEELMKIWPTKTDCRMSGLLSQSKNVHQDLHIQGMTFHGVKDGLGRLDVNSVTMTSRKEILLRTSAVVYLPEEQFLVCRASERETQG